MPLINTNCNLGYDEELHISTKKIRKSNLPPYRLIGRLGRSRMGTKGCDVAGLLKSISHSATWFFWTLDQNRNQETNICRILMKHFTNSEQQKIIRAYKELNKTKVVKRVRRQEYIINPKILLPYPLKNYEKVQEEWDRI